MSRAALDKWQTARAHEHERCLSKPRKWGSNRQMGETSPAIRVWKIHPGLYRLFYGRGQPRRYRNGATLPGLNDGVQARLAGPLLLRKVSWSADHFQVYLALIL